MSKRYLCSLITLATSFNLAVAQESAPTLLTALSGGEEPSSLLKETTHIPGQSYLSSTDVDGSEKVTPREVKAKKPAKPFTPFTGKVKGNKVRVRLKPDIDSQIIREVNKGDLFDIVGEEGDFYAISPPSDAKAYVFRPYVMNNTIEGNHVNVRLSPDTEAPILCHLNQGEHVEGVISETNPKWYEVKAPKSTRFFVAKDLIDNIGSPEVKKKLDERKETVDALYESTLAISGAELDKPFDEIDMDRITYGFKTIINDYADFPDYVEKAKEALAAANETHLQKKVSFLQLKTSGLQKSHSPRAEIITAHQMNDRMKQWKPVEENLFLQWASNNPTSADTIDEFYSKERARAIPLKGIIEAYSAPVKNKPGDFIIRQNDVPVAYVYSTQINLENFVGKNVTLQALPRPNNNFAFPAYFIVGVEQ